MTPKKNPRLNRGATWLTVVSVIACLAVGIGLYHQMSVESDYGPWQDRVSTLVRQIGFGRVLDRVENWVYARHAPSTTAPDPHTLHVLGDAGPADHKQGSTNPPTAWWRYAPS